MPPDPSASPDPVPATRRPGRIRWLVGSLATLVVLAVGGLVTLGWHADRSIERLPVDGLGERRGEAAEPDDDAPAEPAAPADPAELNVLVVGSDSRDGLSRTQARELRLGRLTGRQADTILLVQIRPGGERATVVSIPRDLAVEAADGRLLKLADTLDRGGPGLVVRVVQSMTGIHIDHYVEVSIPGFLDAVEAVGAVEICLDEPLRDRRAGADFTAGCHEMGPAESLAFVRSRTGARGDFERIDRQQQFIAATLDRMTAARTLANPVRVVRIVDRVAPNVRADSGLTLPVMRRLAVELRDAVDGVDTITVPAHPIDVDGVPYVTHYQPGAAALFRDLRRGDTPASRGDAKSRGEVSVGLWTAGRIDSAARIESTLYFGGFRPSVLGRGRVETHTTMVFPAAGSRRQAEWVAATLGARVAEPPSDVALPDGVDVLVVAGRHVGGATVTLP